MPIITKSQALRSGIPSHTLQTIELPKSWGMSKMKAWLHAGHYASSYWRKTDNFIRWMQTPPIEGARYASKKLSDGAILVYQTY